MRSLLGLLVAVGAFIGVSCASLAVDQTQVEAVRNYVRESIRTRAFEFVRADNASCSANGERLGVEQSSLFNQIDMCASPDYHLRELGPAQVSWKRQDAPTAEAEESSADTSTHVIHDYLVFALVTTNNPYSMDVVSMLHSAAVMFPSVSIVFGDAVQFQNFCSQYGIHSLPSVQLFKKGMLYKRYRGKRTAADFAAFLTRFTGQPIRAVPQSFRASNTAFKAYWVEKWGHAPKTWFDKALFISKLFVVVPSTRWSFWDRGAESVETGQDFLVELVSSDPWLLVAAVFLVVRIIYAQYKTVDGPAS